MAVIISFFKRSGGSRRQGRLRGPDMHALHVKMTLGGFNGVRWMGAHERGGEAWKGSEVAMAAAECAD
jgi:hypothetical protein